MKLELWNDIQKNKNATVPYISDSTLQLSAYEDIKYK